jgi:hypothetical protein
MPLRLGGTPTEGWTAAQHARVCADLCALKRSAPLAVMTFTWDNSGCPLASVSLLAYAGQNGVGLDNAPAISYPNSSLVKFSWASAWEDAYGVQHPIYVRNAVLSSWSSDGVAVNAAITVSANAVTLQPARGSADKLTMAVY